jgi:conjugal transfer/type IV secretion protein DotA/TraY
LNDREREKMKSIHMNKKWLWATFALALMAFLAPSVVMAQTLPDLTPGQSDVTVKYFLNELFGGLVGSGGANPMAEVIGKVNGVILILGGLLLGYGLVAGVMQTAHDGEVLGKKWSSMWMPIRMSIGIAAIAPLPSGYSVIQHVVMWLVLQGVGAANLVWTTFAAQTSQLSNISLINDNPKGREIAEAVLRQQLCVIVVNNELNKIPANNNMIAAKIARPLISNGGSGPETSYCGSYDVNPNFVPGATSLNTGGAYVDPRPITAAHQSAFNYLSSNMSVLAQKIYTNVESGGAANDGVAVDFGNVVDSYNVRLTTAAATVMNAANATQNNTITDRASQDGWGMAGAFYMKYMYIKQAATKAMAEFPRVITPKMDQIPSSPIDLRQSVEAYSKRLDVIFADVRYKNSFGVVEQVKADSADNRVVNMVSSSFRVSAAESLYKSDIFGNGNNNKPIMVATKDFGDNVWSTAITANVTLVLLSTGTATVLCNTLTNASGLCDGFKTGLSQMQPFIFTITGALLGFSALLAFYLPVAPFILWFGIVIGWCVLVVEAILAAPLWAIAHVHPDGGSKVTAWFWHCF